MTIEQIAELCHETNRNYCKLIGDASQASWADAPQWQKDSAVNGVRFRLLYPDSPPSASHDSWLAEKRAGGWVYGAVKNPERREHPCCVPYEQLPSEQKVKDALFVGVVNACSDILTPAAKMA